MRTETTIRHYSKAAFAFVFTTTTYLLARTTGFLPSWLGGEAVAKEGALAVVSAQDGHVISGNIIPAQRRLLQQGSGVTLANPIPDQVIQVNQQYTYLLDNVFSGNYSLLGAVETGQNCLPSWLNLQPKLLSTYRRIGGSYNVVTINGSIAFTSVGILLEIVDVLNSSNPQFISGYGSSGLVYEIATNNSNLFIAAADAGLKILDVSNPNNPRLLSGFSAQNGTAYDVAISDNTVFVADGAVGLQTIDVTNISNPRLLSIFPAGLNDVIGVTTNGNTVFLAKGAGGLQIIDVSNTSNPQLISTYVVDAQAVAVSNKQAFVTGYSGLQIVNISNISNPQLLSSFAVGTGYAPKIEITGNTAFVTNGVGGLQIIDVSNSTNPKLIGMYPAGSGRNRGVAVSGNMVITADESLGLHILDLSRASLLGAPPLSGIGQQVSITISAQDMNLTLATDRFLLTLDQLPRVVTSTVSDQSIYPGNSMNLFLSSQLLFTNPGGSFLKLSLTLSNGAAAPSWLSLNLQPILLSTVMATQPANNIVINGSTAFVSGSGRILDVSIPGNPRLLATYTGQNIAINGSTMFVADWSGLKIFDLANLSNPKLISTFQNVTGLGIAISGSTAFVVGGGLQIVDVRNISNPKLLSVFPAGSGTNKEVVVSGNTVFVANGYGGIQILDVRNTTNPRLLSTYDSINYAQGVAISGNTLFVADYWAGLELVDVSNASNPRLLSQYPTPINVASWRVAISGSTAFVADDTAGLKVLDVSNQSNPQLLGIHPGAVGGNAYGIAVSGNTAFLADGPAGLLILDISQWQLTATASPGDVGNYRVQLIATDELGGTASTQPFTIRVESPPKITGVIPAQYARVGQFLNYFVPQGLFTDPNFDSISFTATLVGGSALPSWLAFNGFSAAFAGTPTNAANISILLRATDNIAGSVNTTFNIITSYLPVTDLPIAEQIARIGAPYYFRAPSSAFFDRDGDIVNYTAQRANGQPLPSWLRFNATVQSFSGYPNQTEAGQYDLQLTAIDRYNGQASTILTVWVEHFPVANQTLTNQVVGVGDLLNLALPPLAFTDADSNPLSYRARRPDGSALPNWLGFNPQTLVFNGQPLASDRGTFTVQVVASDPLGASATQNFNLTVIDVPTLGAHIPRQLLNAGVSVQFSVPSSAFSYAGTDPLRYSAYQQVNQSLPSWLQFNNVSLIFSGAPSSNQTGDYSLSVVAQDYYAHAVSNAFDLVVERFPIVNQSIASVSASVGNPMTFTIASTAFADLDGDPLTYSARRADGSALPNWLTFDGSSRVFSGIPVVTDIGAMTLQVIAADPLGGSAQQNMTLTILYAPVINTPPPALKPLREDRVFNLTLSAQTFSDPGGAPLNYSAARLDGSPLPSWLTFFPLNLSFAGTPAITDVSTINIQITATNPQGAYVNLPLSLVIWPNYPPQVMQTLSNQIATVLNAFQFFAPPDTFSDVNEDPLHYTATQVNGQPLPGWLRFDPKKLGFSGTPSRSDTGNFAARVIPVALTAHDDKSSTSTQFNISVQGTSGVALFLQVIIPLLSSLATGYTLYRKRALLLNRYKPQRYQQLAEEKVMIGDRYERQLATPVDQVKKVKVMLPHARKDCLRIFMLPYRPLPGGVDLPAWLSYDTNANILRSKGPIPATASAHLIVQVRGADNVIVEQFPLHIDRDPAEAKELDEAPVVTPALPGLGDENAIEMQSVNNMGMAV